MLYNYLIRKGPMLAFLVTVVCLVITLVPIFGGLEAFSAIPTAQQAFANEGGIFNTGIYLTAFLLAVSVIAAVVLSIFQVVNNPKGSMQALLAFLGLTVLFVVFYFTASTTGTGSYAQTLERFALPEWIVKVIGGGITLTTILLLASVVIMIVLEVWNYFKNQ